MMEKLILLTPINDNKYLGVDYQPFFTTHITKIIVYGNSENSGNIKVWNGDELIINEAFSEKEYTFESKIVLSPGIHIQLENGFGYCEIWGYYDMDN